MLVLLAATLSQILGRSPYRPVLGMCCHHLMLSAALSMCVASIRDLSSAGVSIHASQLYSRTVSTVAWEKFDFTVLDMCDFQTVLMLFIHATAFVAFRSASVDCM